MSKPCNRAPSLASAPRAFLTLEIPDAVPIPWDAVNASLYGVGSAAINNGLNVFVEAYEGMASGDRVEVYWDDSGVPFASLVVDSGNINQRLGMTLAESLFIEGDVQPFYRIVRLSGSSGDSPSRAIRVQLSTPGGTDPDPSTSHNENLVAPQLPEDIQQNGVDAEQAAAGVDVTIPAYPDMKAYDRLDFSWGGQRRVHTVLPEELGQALRLHIEQAQILAAGDGEIRLMYQVIDAAANRSDGWSAVTQVDVYAAGAVIDAPIVVGAVDGELDLASLAGQDVTVQVLVTSDHFALGDTVELSWDGTSESGMALDWTGTQAVLGVPQVLAFAVPYDSVAAIAGGQATVYYTLHKTDGSTLFSRRLVVHVSGTAQLLAAPRVREASNGTLAASVEQATVDISPYLGMAGGDLVTLLWSGEKATGEPTDYRVERTISDGAVGATLTIAVPGAEQVLPLAGGSVDVSYQVAPVGGLSRATQASEHLALSVQAAASSLPAPRVAEALNGVLAPDVPQATVEILPYAGMAEGDRVDLYWVGNATGEYSDYLPVSSATVGRTLAFSIASAHIQPNSNVQVDYAVTRAAGGREVSLVLPLRIGTS